MPRKLFDKKKEFFFSCSQMPQAVQHSKLKGISKWSACHSAIGALTAEARVVCGASQSWQHTPMPAPHPQRF